MKKYILSIIASLFVITAVTAQNESTETVKPRKSISKQERFILDFGFDSWTKLPAGINTQLLKSRRFEFYSMKDKAFANGHMGFAYGLGMSFTNVNSNAQFYNVVNGSTVLIPIDSVSPSQNKLSTNYLEIPLELRFRTSPIHNGKRLKLSVGAKVGWDFQNHLKYVDGGLKEKFYNAPNLAPFRFAYTARLGYGNWSLMGYYGINSLYTNGKGPNLIPFGVGIALTPHFGGIAE